MKRSAVYVALLLVVVIAVAVLCVRLFAKQAQPETPKPTASVQTLPPLQTLPPEQTAAPVVTAAPTPTPEPAPKETEKPIETRAPIVTEPPVGQGAVAAEGSFRSNTGTGLNLAGQWAAAGDGTGPITLTVALAAEHYSLYTSALYNSLELRVNGKTYTASSPEIRYDGKELQTTPLTVFTAELSPGPVTLEAVWHYKGSYSGKQLTDITASTTFKLG